MTAAIFKALCRESGLPEPVAEHRFHDTRKFRFDWAWPKYRVALEQQGGIWVRGAHGRGTGIARDIEKLSLAASMGWLVILCVPKELCSQKTMDYIKGAVGNSAFGHSTIYIPERK